MSILEKYDDIMNENISTFIRKSKLSINDINDKLAYLKEILGRIEVEAGPIIARAKYDKINLSEAKKTIIRLQKGIKKAILLRNEEDAKILEESKSNKEENLYSLLEQCELSNDNLIKMKRMHNKLISDIRNLENRQAVIRTIIANHQYSQSYNDINNFKRAEKEAESLFISDYDKEDSDDDEILEKYINKNLGNF